MELKDRILKTDRGYFFDTEAGYYIELSDEICDVIEANPSDFQEEGERWATVEDLIDDQLDKLPSVQPKTTSTDIEELRKKFKLLFGVVHQNDKVDPWFNGKELTTDRVFDFFLPHLSNKSELKKEAVMGFVGFLSKQLLAVGGTWQELELKQKTLDKINKSAQQYLSSNEKEVSQLNKENK